MKELQAVVVVDPQTGQETLKHGVVIGFTDVVQVSTATATRLGTTDPVHVFTVDAPNLRIPAATQLGFACRCPAVGDVFAVKVVQVDPDGRIARAVTVTDPEAKALAFVFSDPFVKNVIEQIPSDLGVQLHGDFVVDHGGPGRRRGVRPRRPADRGPPEGSPFGIQGGLFQELVHAQGRLTRRGDHGA